MTLRIKFILIWACHTLNCITLPCFYHVITCKRDTWAHTHIHKCYCHRKASRHPHLLQRQFDSKPSVTFIMREYLSKPLTSLSSTSAPFGRCIHFSELGMNISELSDRSSEEWKERRSRWEGEVQGGMGNHIWFCRSHKWLKLCRFQSDYLSLHHLHRFPSVIALSLHFPLPSCRSGIIPVYDKLKKKKKTLMVVAPNFTEPWWACVGRATSK